MFKLFKRLMTKNLKEIPLFWVNFNYESFKEYGKKNSCTASVHPSLTNDRFIRERLNEIVDYIRNTYDMNKM